MFTIVFQISEEPQLSANQCSYSYSFTLQYHIKDLFEVKNSGMHRSQLFCGNKLSIYFLIIGVMVGCVGVVRAILASNSCGNTLKLLIATITDCSATIPTSFKSAFSSIEIFSTM